MPEFSIAHYHITDDFLSMVWLAMPPYFDNGPVIMPEQPFLIVRLKANENTILHEAIAIGPQLNPQFIPPSRPPYIIRLIWDEAIVSSTLDLADGRQLVFYPNPVTDAMHIMGLTDQDEGIITLCNPIGQIVFQSPLQETVELASLQPGMYYVSVFVDARFSKAVPVVKIQH